jgi:hypothetical protein
LERTKRQLEESLRNLEQVKKGMEEKHIRELREVGEITEMEMRLKDQIQVQLRLSNEAKA